MKKIYLRTFFVLLSALFYVNSFSQSASATWALTSNGTASISGSISAGSHVFGPGVQYTSYWSNGATSYYWNSGSLDNNDYYQYSMSPASGYNLVISLIQLSHRVNNGSMTAAVYYSYDSDFSSAIQVGSNFSVSTTHTVKMFNGLTLAVNDGETLYVRVYGWGANQWYRNFNNRDVLISGTTSISASPPVAEFSASTTTPSVGQTVDFTDNSTNLPTVWAWTFSPSTVTYTGGSSATSQNPEVQFNNNGYYTVTLYAENIYGNDTETKTNYVLVGTDGKWTGNVSTDWSNGNNWETLSVPSGSSDITIPASAPNWPTYTGNFELGINCSDITLEGSSELNINGDCTIPDGNTITCDANATIRVSGTWKNIGNFIAGNGTIELYGSNDSEIGGESEVMGGGKVNFGIGKYLTGYNVYNIFDCYTNFTLLSANVDANGAGNRTFYWANSSGTIQESITVYVPDGESRVDLNFNITTGTDLRLGVSGTSANLWRDNTGVSYPYDIGDVASIKSSASGSIYYYYCYDLEYTVNSGLQSFNDLTISKSNSIVTTGSDISTSGDLTVMPGAGITNTNGTTLSIGGNLVLESDASGMASFINKGTFDVSGTSKVERYLTQLEWHFIGIPVASATADVFHLPGGHSNIWLYPHDEASNTWGSSIVDVSTPLNLGQGYNCYVDDNADQDETITFEGTINSGDFTTGSDGFYDLNFTSGSGVNFISNPYTSALVGNIHTWTKTNLDNSIWVWDDSYGNYLYWTGTGSSNGEGYGTLTGGIIPSMQGFFVLANGSSPSLTIPAADQTHSSQAFYKSSELPVNTLRLDVKGNIYQDAIFVRFDELATENYDPDMDVQKMFGLEESPQLYTVNLDEKLSVNALPELDGYEIIQMGFECAVPGLFTITASNLDNFKNNETIYLEDLKEGTMQNLKEINSYSFSNGLNDDPNRFLLHFGASVGTESTADEQISVYVNDDIIYIQLSEIESAQIEVFDLLGRKIVSEKSENMHLKRIRLPEKTGYYIVKIQTEQHFFTEKVFIK